MPTITQPFPESDSGVMQHLAVSWTQDRLNPMIHFQIAQVPFSLSSPIPIPAWRHHVFEGGYEKYDIQGGDEYQASTSTAKAEWWTWGVIGGALGREIRKHRYAGG